MVHAAQARKKILFVYTSLLCLAQLISKDVQHELTVTVGVDVTVCFQIQVSFQFWRIDEISIMGKADAVWTVHIERLCFGIGTATSCRVAQVPNTHGAGKVRDFGAILEDLGGHAIGLQLVDSAPGRTGRNTGCILTTVCATQRT